MEKDSDKEEMVGCLFDSLRYLGPLLMLFGTALSSCPKGDEEIKTEAIVGSVQEDIQGVLDRVYEVIEHP